MTHARIGLHHVSIPVPPGELDAGRSFYGDLLGLPEVPPPAALGPERVAWFQLGDAGECELHLFIEPDANARPSGRHLAFLLDSETALDELAARLNAAGVTHEIADDIVNRPRWFIHDPFGNRVECTTILGPYA